MIQKAFLNRARDILSEDLSVVGLAVGGSWLYGEIDEFSDIDLILVTEERVSSSRSEMLWYANRIGKLLTGFTGEHVGDPRVLICLYDSPLLHVDIKFLTIDELYDRVESPHILIDRNNLLRQAIDKSKAFFPYPSYQWIEDRFWTWIHYTLLKIGRGEYMEAIHFIGFIRATVLGPLLHVKNGSLPRGLRKVEMVLSESDLRKIKSTIPEYKRSNILKALRNVIVLYKSLRNGLYSEEVELRHDAERAVIDYFLRIRER